MPNQGTDELSELQDESQWDFEHAERQRAPAGARAVVSVAFKSPDFALVTAAAREAGQPTSQFIRQAAVAAATGRRVRPVAGRIVVRNQAGSVVEFSDAVRSLVVGGLSGSGTVVRSEGGAVLI